MSGHTPMLLELTPSRSRPDDAIARLFQLLENDDYLGRFRRGSRREAGDRSLDGGPIVLDAAEVFIEVSFLPDPEGGGGVCAAIALDSKAYEMAFDVLRGRSIPEGKRALVEFCAEVAAACDAEGFRLRHQDGPPRALSLSDLLRELGTVNGNLGTICGLSTRAPGWPSVRPRWPRWKMRRGYAMQIFL